MAGTVHADAKCDFLDRVIEQRKQRTVVTQFLHADLVDEARGTLIVRVSHAVALHSHCAPDSVPKGFCMRQSFRNAIHELVHGTPEDSPQQRLWVNIRRAVHALQTGKLRTRLAALDLFGKPYYDENTLVDLEDFRVWAESERLPIVGPWTVRGETASRPVGYVALFAARPHHAAAMEGLSKHFGDELAAGCPHGHDAMKHYCMEMCGLGPTEAARLVAEMDPRPERRGRPAGK